MLRLAPGCNVNIRGYVRHPYPMAHGPQVRSWSFVDLDAFRSTSGGQWGKKYQIKRERNMSLNWCHEPTEAAVYIFRFKVFAVWESIFFPT